MNHNRRVFSLPRILPRLSVRPTGRWYALTMGLALALGAASARAQVSAASPPTGTGRVRMEGSFRTVAADGKMTAAVRAQNVRDTLTAAEASAPMNIRLMLRMRNADELSRRVTAGEIISREEMAARFLPDAKDHQVVADWLAAQGLTVKPAGASHALVRATGTPVQLEKAFETHFARVQYEGEERTSATVAPSVPAEVQARISGVHGLQPHLHVRTFSRPGKDAIIGDPKLLFGSAPYYVKEIAKAYNVSPTGLTGAGQTIAIIIDIPPPPSDLRTFYTNNALPQTTDHFSVVDVEHVGTFDYSVQDTDYTEAALDTEWSTGIAVGASLVVYATNSLLDIDDAYGAVLDDLQSGAQPDLHQLSMSYGEGEQDSSSDEIFGVHDQFTAITAYGVTLFASSGDDGSSNGEGFDVTDVNYPASDPLVTGVGGTTLALTASQDVADQSVMYEYAWSPPGGGTSDSSGGGVSVLFPLPSYQEGVVDATNNSSLMRQVPDVAFAADPDTGAYLIYRGQPVDIGGTSWSSPCWAGLCALINQQRASQGRGPITRLNSRLYPMLGTNAFRDIIYGDNGAYNAGIGYDLVTGLGVPDFAALTQQLTKDGQFPDFFIGQTLLSDNIYYLALPDSTSFSYYTFLNGSTNYIYHFDLGYEYVFDAKDQDSGIYLYDFASGSFWYTSPVFEFPYLYDFKLNTVIYYYPDPNNPGRYDTNGVRYFYRFDTGTVFSE